IAAQQPEIPSKIAIRHCASPQSLRELTLSQLHFAAKSDNLRNCLSRENEGTLSSRLDAGDRLEMSVEKSLRDVIEIENLWIPLADGCRLAARIWMPADAEKNPVPAIIEYIPYRKRDQTS